jgi:hypothetical protein
MKEKSISQLYREDQLGKVSRDIGSHNSRLSCDEGQNNGTITPANYSSEGLKNNAEFFRKRAGVNLVKACGACALQQACKMNGNIGLWSQSHPVAGPNNLTKSGEETRKGMLSRIRRSDRPEYEPCDERQIDPNLVPTEQLKMAI